LKLRRSLVAVAVFGLVFASLGLVAIDEARADPPTELNDASVFAINVPGSVLADAAPVGLSGAILAAGQTFDWANASAVYAQVSGTFTSTPVAPDIGLTPSERALWDQIVRNYKGAPAIRATHLVKGAGVVTAYFAGAQIGNETVKVLGIDADGLVCSSTEGLGQVVVALLAGADCTEYNQMVEEFQANIDVDPTVGGGTSCTPTGDCLAFVHEQKIQYVTPFGYGTPSQWHSTRFWCFDQSSGSGNFNYLTAAGMVVTGTNVWPTTNKPLKALATCPGNRFISIGATSSSAPHPAFKDVPLAWVYSPSGTYAQVLACLNGTGPCSGGSRVVPTVSVEDIERTLECRIVGSDNITYTASSETFTEGSRVLPDIVCPELPSGVTALSITVVEVGGEVSWTLLDEDATPAYIDLVTQFPACVNGSCYLDLRQGTHSCFEAGIDCDGWFTDPDRNSIYSCYFGTSPVPLNQCYTYSTTFSPTHQGNGTAYADPITGDSVSEPTSPTAEDRLTLALLERGWLTVGPTPADFRMGDAQYQPERYETARTVARRCIAVGVLDDCFHMAIFAPGDNIKDAAVHDLEAITSKPAWASLTRASPSIVEPGWHAGKPPCISPYAPLHCDEYPYASSYQGGYLSGSQASLKLIDAADNVHEGTYLELFFSGCEIGDGDHFLVIPIPSPDPDLESRTGPPTAAWCT
jgi:hypothetical protein